MLEKLKLINFQGHINSVLEFSKGVNVIIGESDEGKSSIIRAIEYLGRNTPNKNNYKNRKCSNKDLMEIAGTFNGTVVTRLKSKTINQYRINDEKPFKAIKAELPDEVHQIMKLNDINIQSQSDAYFMLNLTPGQVAKKINKVVNLEVMHKVLTATKTDITEAKQNTLFWTKKKDDYVAEVKTLAWVINARKDGDNLNMEEGVITGEIDRYNLGLDITEKYQAIQKERKKFKRLPAAIKEIQKIEKLQKEIATKVQKYNSLDTLTDQNNKIQKQLSAYKSIQIAQNVLNELILLTEEIQTADKVRELLIKCINAQTNIRNAQQTVTLAQKEFTKALKANKVCPFCERKM